jgi:hypothetical protein
MTPSQLNALARLSDGAMLPVGRSVPYPTAASLVRRGYASWRRCRSYIGILKAGRDVLENYRADVKQNRLESLREKLRRAA